MKYTKHLSSVIKNQDSTELSSSSFQTILKIIYLEGAISSLEKIKSKNNNISSKNKYDIWLADYQKKLESQTGELNPDDLISILVSKSA